MNHDPNTLDALNASIEHWHKNTLAENIEEFDISSRSCALCAMFLAQHCRGCPIYAKTGFATCHNSPYENVRKAMAYYDFSAAIKASNDMANFLKDLRGYRPKDGSE